MLEEDYIEDVLLLLYDDMVVIMIDLV